MNIYQLIDTDTRQVVATGSTEAAVLAYTSYLPADCVPGAETWDDVMAVAREHVDGVPGVVEGYAVEECREVLRQAPADFDAAREGGAA